MRKGSKTKQPGRAVSVQPVDEKMQGMNEEERRNYQQILVNRSREFERQHNISTDLKEPKSGNDASNKKSDQEQAQLREISEIRNKQRDVRDNRMPDKTESLAANEENDDHAIREKDDVDDRRKSGDADKESQSNDASDNDAND